MIRTGDNWPVADMPEANRFMLHVMAAVAEQEGRAISERTTAALAAAKARGVNAQNNLGVMYDYGDGVPKDHAEAVRWYRRAAAQGFVLAK